jgi:hypothetical protein
MQIAGIPIAIRAKQDMPFEFAKRTQGECVSIGAFLRADGGAFLIVSQMKSGPALGASFGAIPFASRFVI